MGEGSGKKTAVMIAAAVVVVAALAGGAFYLTRPDSAAVQLKDQAAGALDKTQGPLAAYAVGTLAKLETHAQPKAVPAVSFDDRDGKPVSLADFKGRVTVVNVWATWCAPCVTEMPTLAALQKGYPTDKLVVVPVSVDRDVADAKSFIDVHAPLALYHDPKFALPHDLGVMGMPTTLILDRNGREVARLSGESDWNSPDARKLFDALLK
ncbi:TlpA family protein disulfide reductase [Caulobacter sp. 17J65-9]|nr:TlpA family protein disulfide reductase [Caulobacter sp. 17J65-9]